VFARGDRRLAAPLLTDYRLGCRFDGWTDQFRLDLCTSFALTASTPTFICVAGSLMRLTLGSSRSGVTKKWLQRDLAKAFALP